VEKWAPLTDIKILLNVRPLRSHGGAAEVIRQTRAKNMVMEGDVSVVETGARTDFCRLTNILTSPRDVDRILHDEEP